MSTPKILAFAGSTREGSFNKKLLRVVGKATEQAGAEVTYVDLRDFPMPLYDGDLESAHGLPEQALRFRELMQAHHGLLIASAEYNSSFSGVLKNTIDWASRPRTGEPPLACFTGKVAGLCSASTGSLGGLRGLVHLRAVLGNIGVLVIPEQVAVASANDAFDEQGSLKDQKRLASCEKLATRLAAVTRKLL